MLEDECSEDGVDEHQKAQADVREDEGGEPQAEAKLAAHFAASARRGLLLVVVVAAAVVQASAGQ